MRVVGDENEPADRARQQVEDEVASAAERALDIVAEHPQEDHVAGEMRDVGVQELVGHERGRRRQPSARTDISDQGGRREPEGVDHVLEAGTGGAGLVQKDCDVGGDHAPGHDRLYRLREGIVVVDRYDHARRPLQRFWPGCHSTSDAPLSLACLAATNRKSESRLTYLSAVGVTVSPGWSLSSTMMRSARRHTVRAR